MILCSSTSKVRYTPRKNERLSQKSMLGRYTVCPMKIVLFKERCWFLGGCNLGVVHMIFKSVLISFHKLGKVFKTNAENHQTCKTRRKKLAIPKLQPVGDNCQFFVGHLKFLQAPCLFVSLPLRTGPRASHMRKTNQAFDTFFEEPSPCFRHEFWILHMWCVLDYGHPSQKSKRTSATLRVSRKFTA